MSFGVLELADLIFPLILLPSWAISLVLWMLILGFPPLTLYSIAVERCRSMIQGGVSRT